MSENDVLLVPHSISTQVYTALKKDIIEGSLKPGTRLLVLDIAGKYQISQAPVREALERLKQEGLITSKPNKGSMVSNITDKEIHDIFVLREMIEGFAVRQSMPLLTDRDFAALNAIIGRMESAVKARDMLAIIEHDMEFHGYFYERCDNQAVLELWNHMKTKVMRFMAISNRHSSIEGLAEWHYRLVEGLRSGDVKEAEARFVHHMRSYKLIHLEEEL